MLDFVPRRRRSVIFRRCSGVAGAAAYRFSPFFASRVINYAREELIQALAHDEEIRPPSVKNV